MRWHADAAEVDVVEVAQCDAVEHQHFGGDGVVLLEDGAHRLRHVAVEDQVDRLTLLDRARQAELDRLRESREALERRLGAQAKRERHLGVALGHVERSKLLWDGGRHRRGFQGPLEAYRWLQHLQVFPRQELAGLRYVDRIAGELHAVFGGAESGGADALAGRQQLPGELLLLDLAAQRHAEAPAKVAEVAVLAAIDVLRDAAGTHDPGDAREAGERRGEVVLLVGLLNQAAQGLGKPIGEAIELCRAHFASQLPIEARLARQALARWIESRNTAAVVHDNEAAADVDRGRLADLAMRHHGELGGTATDVYVQDMPTLVVRALRRPRTIGGEHRFHVVAGGGADGLARHLGPQPPERPRVLAPQRLAGEDHPARV